MSAGCRSERPLPMGHNPTPMRNPNTLKDGVTVAFSYIQTSWRERRSYPWPDFSLCLFSRDNEIRF